MGPYAPLMEMRRLDVKALSAGEPSPALHRAAVIVAGFVVALALALSFATRANAATRPYDGCVPNSPENASWSSGPKLQSVPRDELPCALKAPLHKRAHNARHTRKSS